MNNGKITGAFAVLVALIMMAVPIMIVDDADAAPAANATSTGLGEFNISLKIASGTVLPEGVAEDSDLANISSNWISFKADATDGYLAVVDVMNDIGLANSTYVMDGNYTVSTPYFTNNLNYGTITTLLGLSNTDSASWQVFVYQNGWKVGSDAIGLYQPFDDYVDEYTTANIALYYGATIAAPAAGDLTIMPETVVPKNASQANAGSYAVSFSFQYNDGEDDQIITKTGYGSNGYTALVNAIGTEASTGVVGSSDFATYGWITTIFGLGTVQTGGLDTPDNWKDDTYTYWNLNYYDSSSNPAAFKYSNLTTAFYCPLSGSAFQCNSFEFVYQ